MKPQQKILAVSMALVLTTGCVTASKHKELEDEYNHTQAQLATCESQKAELEKRLGITSTEKTNLEGDVANMKRALTELEARRQAAEKRLGEFRELTSKFKKLVDSGKLSIKMRNGRMTIALSTDVLFASGSAKLSAEGAASIKEVSGILKDLANRNYQIEGHTDNVPIKTKQFPSNWELASARAMSVLDTMLDSGLEPGRLSVASYGSYDPTASNETPEGRRENRRIAIVIVPDLSSLPGFEELNRLSSEPKAPAEAKPSPSPSAEKSEKKSS